MGKLKTTKKINRKCVVCGKNIKITLYEDRNYRNGHFFGKIKIPIKGAGEYKKVGTSKLFGKKINVVKWTGKEKKAEYWECNTCFEEAMHEDWLEQMIKKLYGKKCPDYEKDCGCCQAWNIYETIIDFNRGKI